MALTKNVDGKPVPMTVDEEAAFNASRPSLPAAPKRDVDALLDALIAENVVPSGKRAAILARL